MNESAQPLKGEDCQALASRVLSDLRRHDLGKQQLVIVMTLVEISYQWGRETVKVPKLELLAQLTGMQRTHVAATLKELSQIRVIQTKKHEQYLEFRVVPDSNLWRCRPRVSPGTSRNALDWLRVHNFGDGGVKLMALGSVEVDFPTED